MEKIKDCWEKIKDQLFLIASSEIKKGEEKRKNLILNLILIGLIFFIVIFITIFSLKELATKTCNDFSFFRYFLYLSLSFLYLLVIFYLSKKLKTKKASFLLIIFFFILSIKIAFILGIDKPLTIFSLILIIITSSVLIKPTFSFFSAGFLSILIFIFKFLEHKKVIRTMIGETTFFSYTNLTTFSIFFLFFAILSYLYNSEIEKNIKDFRELKKSISIEKTLFANKERHIKYELENSQKEEISHFQRLIDLGKMSGSFFHELANPLTSITFNLEEIKTLCQGQDIWKKLEKNVERTILAAKKMGCFISSVRKQSAKKESSSVFSVNQEIEEIIEILTFKARKNSAFFLFTAKKNFSIFLNQIKFHQVMINLMSNAVDSYANKKSVLSKKILISLSNYQDNIIISIKDNGCGLSKKEKEKIFNPFFTTKIHTEGSGLGLPLARSIVEDIFKGKIIVNSRKNKGSKFIVQIPIKEN